MSISNVLTLHNLIMHVLATIEKNIQRAFLTMVEIFVLSISKIGCYRKFYIL